MSWRALRSVISLQGSEYGRRHCAVQVGPMIGRFGQDHALASHSATPENEKD